MNAYLVNIHGIDTNGDLFSFVQVVDAPSVHVAIAMTALAQEVYSPPVDGDSVHVLVSDLRDPSNLIVDTTKD